MNYIILFVCLAGLIVWAFTLVNLELYLQFVRKYYLTLRFQVIIVFLALVFGAALIFYAEDSKFPGVLVVLGALYLTQGTLLAAIGRANFQRMIGWGLNNYRSPLRHVSGLGGVGLVAFLIYAVV